MIAYFRHQRSGCYYYRILQKMEALNSAGISTKQIELGEDVPEYDQITSVQFYGIYPFSLENVLTQLKKDGKRIIYDTDDALELIDESNPFYYAVKKDMWSFREILPFADEITVSTTSMATYVKNIRPDVKISVIPNTYNPTDWTFQRPKREGIRIGYAGSPTHLPDLQLILPAIKNLQKKYPVIFILMGLGPYDKEKSFNVIRKQSYPQVVKDLDIVDNLLKDIKYEWVPNVDYEQYFPTLINTSLDFGLCPLTNTPFNQHRSAVKALEYTLSGALAIASNMPGYNEDATSVLTLDNDWESKIEYCITHPQEVEMQKKIHLTWAHENRNVNDQVPLLKEIYLG